MERMDVFQMLAGIIVSVSFIPEIVQIFRENSVTGLSISYLFLFGVGIIMYIILGVIKRDKLNVIINSITFVFIIIIIVKYSQIGYNMKKNKNKNVE